VALHVPLRPQIEAFFEQAIATGWQLPSIALSNPRAQVEQSAPVYASKQRQAGGDVAASQACRGPHEVVPQAAVLSLLPPHEAHKLTTQTNTASAKRFIFCPSKKRRATT